jgi:Arc/MetJ-type ribon-helix-helix transcriptional regulator
MKMLSVRLDDEEAAALEAVCQARGMSRSDVVKRAIRELAQAERRKPFGLVARELGLIGSFAGARDLGEHHSKHLRRALRAKTAR